jgi:hypothetical protein
MTRLTPKYGTFCAFETVAINGVGCGTLVFQDQLAERCSFAAFYEYWFVPPIPLSETEHLMCYMIAAWLAVAGILQMSINFDPNVPKRTKLAALYTFAACDLAWIVLMVLYTSLFSPYHIIGSALTIYQRGQFWMPNGEAMFIEEESMKVDE